MIINDGFIYNSTIYRKTMVSQFLRNCISEDTDFKTTFDRYLTKIKPYEYMWQTLYGETKALSHIKDSQEMKSRTRFFNGYAVKKICKDSLYLFDNTPAIKTYLRKIMNANSYREMTIYLEKIKNHESLKNRHAPKHRLWLNAFTGAGLYNTFSWLIKFDNCRFYTNDGMKLDLYESMLCTEELINESKHSYNKLFPILEQFIIDNKSASKEMNELYESIIRQRQSEEAC